MRRMTMAMLVVSLMVVGTGCALLSELLRGSFTTPELRFKTARLGAVSLSDAALDLVWELDNPNPVGIQLARLDYAFFVEGKQVVAGAPPMGLNINPSGPTELTFPASIKFQDIVPVLTTFLQKDFAGYRAQGTLGIQTPIGILDLPLSHEGQFEVPKVPTIQLLPPRITNLGLTSATVEFPLAITSKNTYPLPLNAITGAIQVAGASVGNVSLSNLGAIQPQTPSQVSVPLTIQFLQAAQAAMAIRSGSPTTIAFNGSVQSGFATIPLQFQQNLTFQR